MRVDVKTLVVPEGGELPPEEELAAMEAEVERAAATEAAAAAGDEAPSEESFEPGDEDLVVEARPAPADPAVLEDETILEDEAEPV